jgi:hypothetical protein
LHKERACSWCTNPSIIINGLLWHVVFAEVGEKVIANDGVNRFKSFAGRRLLVLGGGGRGKCGERSDDGSGGCSDGSHLRGENNKERGGRTTCFINSDDSFLVFGSCPLPRSLASLPLQPWSILLIIRLDPTRKAALVFFFLGLATAHVPRVNSDLSLNASTGHHDGPPSGCSPLLPRQTQAFFFQSPFRFRIELPRRMTSFITLKPPAAVSRTCLHPVFFLSSGQPFASTKTPFGRTPMTTVIASIRPSRILSADQLFGAHTYLALFPSSG